MIIYTPLFVDAFFRARQKAVWLSLIILGGPIGTCIGFSLSGFLTAHGYDWRISFFVLSIAMYVSTVLIWLLPNSYLDL